MHPSAASARAVTARHRPCWCLLGASVRWRRSSHGSTMSALPTAPNPAFRRVFRIL